MQFIIPKGILRGAIYYFAVLLLAEPVMGAQITIDQDTTIDASSSFPEPPPGDPELFVDISEGSAGPPTVQIKDGGVIGGFVTVGDESHLVMRGGEIQALTRVVDKGTLSLSGGRIAPLIRFYVATDVIGVLELEDTSILNIQGGDVFGTIIQHDASTINVFGYGFQVEGELPTSMENISAVRINGFYADGSPLSIDIARLSSDAKVFLHNVPEPSVCVVVSWAIFGFIWHKRSHRSS